MTATTGSRLLRIGATEFLAALTTSPSGLGTLRAEIRPMLVRTHPSLADSVDT